MGEGFENSWMDRLLIVPGNHDVDLKVQSSDYIDYHFGDNETKKVSVSVMESKVEERRKDGQIDTTNFPRAQFGHRAFSD